MRMDSITFGAASRRLAAIPTKRSRSRFNIATLENCRMPQSAHCNSNAICSGPFSIRFIMHTPPDDARPQLARGVRLQIDNLTGKGVLLYPEGIVELNETAQE